MGKLVLVLQSDKVDIYSPRYDGEHMTEFERFLTENEGLKHPQLKAFFDAILSSIEKIQECGARENLFRNEGGRVKAIPLYFNYPGINKSVGKIRLYCLRISEQILIIGYGGVTLKQKYQEDPVMQNAVDDLRYIDRNIKRIARQAQTDFEDYNAISVIINSITL